MNGKLKQGSLQWVEDMIQHKKRKDQGRKSHMHKDPF